MRFSGECHSVPLKTASNGPYLIAAVDGPAGYEGGQPRQVEKGEGVADTNSRHLYVSGTGVAVGDMTFGKGVTDRSDSLTVRPFYN